MALKVRTTLTIFCMLVLLVIMIAEAKSGNNMDHCGSPTENLTCSWQNLCQGHFNNCHCDDACDIYNDCCPDFEVRDSMKNRYPSAISCRDEPKIGMIWKIFMFDKCPEFFSDDVKRNLCEQRSSSEGMISKLPVSDKNGVLFGNIYCAICNGLKYEDLHFWKADISCEKAIEMHNMAAAQQALKDGTCTMKYLQPRADLPARKCYKAVSTCLPEYEDTCIQHHCENSTFTRHVFGIYGTLYKNEHCALCNHDKSDQTFPKFACESDILDGGPDNWYPMSIIIDLNTAGGGKVGYKEYGRTINETETKTCETGFILDILQNECILVSCAPGLTQVGQECMAASEEIRDCVRHKLAPHEYQILDNGTMVDMNGRSYNASQYRDFGNGTMAVCINTPAPKGEKYVYKFDEAQTIFSIVGQCISIICLVLLLAVYSILPQLRNPPGKSIMALAASLLAAQVLFLFGVGQTDPHGLCVTIGVLIHYSFLASFFWMGIMSLDIWATFAESSSANAFAHRSNKFIKYCLGAFGCPLVIVVVALILDFITAVPEQVRPGYGDGWCWIVHRISLIIFFGAPIFTIIFINILLYCLTLRALHHISQETKRVHRDDSEQQRFWLYVKLSTIMGLTWIFGLVAVVADVHVLWYIFLFFNTLQGAFIFISFIFTRKVIKHLKDKFRKTWPRHSQTTDTEGTTKSTDLSKKHTSSSSPSTATKTTSHGKNSHSSSQV